MALPFLPQVAGVALGLLVSYLLCRSDGEDGLWRNARRLFVAVAAVYPLLACWHGLPTFPLEAAAGAGAVLALFASRRSVGPTAAAFACHAGWDFVHRGPPLGAPVPVWYPAFCALLDLTVVSCLLLLHSSSPRQGEGRGRGEGS